MTESTVIPLNGDLLRKWVNLPGEHEIQTPVTRATVDRLFFALNGLANSQAHMQSALIAFVAGNTDVGNAQLDLQRTALVEATNQLNTFLTNIIIGETVDQDG